ncbi:hypothetical protein BDZ91DRAFT_70100 [Kalaharituber pfeilii]|nr:hypothetical protein BDZ91DRAFT_70100 [Kalaharituber pfeilii]
MDCSQSDMARDEGYSINVVNGHRREGKERGSRDEKKELLCVLLGVDCEFARDKRFNNAALVKEDVHRHLLSFQCDRCLKRFPKRHNLNRHKKLSQRCKKQKEAKELSVDQKGFLKKLNGAKGIERIKAVVKPWKTLFAEDDYFQKLNTCKRKSSEIPAGSVPGAQKKIRRNETDSGTLPSWGGSLNNAPYAYSPTQVDMSSTAAARNSTEYDHNGHQNRYMQMNSIMEQEQSGNSTPLSCNIPVQISFQSWNKRRVAISLPLSCNIPVQISFQSWNKRRVAISLPLSCNIPVQISFQSWNKRRVAISLPLSCNIPVQISFQSWNKKVEVISIPLPCNTSIQLSF